MSDLKQESPALPKSQERRPLDDVSSSSASSSSSDPDLTQFVAYIRAFIVPTLLLKFFLIYFGLNYSRYPGEGYGWGLLATAVVGVSSVLIFLWRNRGAK